MRWSSFWHNYKTRDEYQTWIPEVGPTNEIHPVIGESESE